MADKADLVIYQGDDWAAVVTVNNIDGTPADITGYTAQAQIRADVADIDPLVLVEMATSVTSPHVVLNIPHADTVELDGGCYVWDVQITSGTGEITTLLYGAVNVRQEVTRE